MTIDRPPRKGDDALAAALGVSPTRAAEIRRRVGSGQYFDEFDAKLRAEASLADRNAVASIDEFDIDDFVQEPEPAAAMLDEVQRRSDQRLRSQLGAHVSWANTVDRTARTAKARAALEQKWLDLADGDPVRAENFRKAHYLRMALKSVEARRANGAKP